MNCVFSTYFSKNIDLQRHWKTNSNDFLYIKNWYDCIQRFDLNAVVFGDDFSDEFINTYQTDKIQFIKVEQSALNTIDYRWVVYDKYLSENKDKFYEVLFTDIWDVIIMEEPFFFMSLSSVTPDMIYIGTDQFTISTNDWLLQRNIYLHKTLLDIHEYEKIYADEKVLNCGIVGGHINVMSKFVHDMATILLQSDPGYEATIDMSVANYLIYTKYKDFFTGYPLNTKYKEYENRTDCIFKHK